MPREHGDSEDPGVCRAVAPDRVFQTSPPNRGDVFADQCPDSVERSPKRIGESMESLEPLVYVDSQLCISFGPVVLVKDIVLRRPCVIRGRLKSTVVVEDIQGPSFECLLDDGTGTIVLVFLGRRSVPGMIAGAVLLVQGTPGILEDRGVIINPIYEFLPQSINVTSSGGLEDIRSTM